MNPKAAAERLAANAQIFRHLLATVPAEQAVWKPAPEKWSLLEVINHLADEERLDFRQRLDLVLHHPGEPWPGIDPESWVHERQYNLRDLEESLEDFLAERRRSVEWLGNLVSVDLDAEYEHPRGNLSAGDLLGSWLAHDLLHIRQMTRLHYDYLSQEAAPYAVGYAGTWQP